MRFYYDEGGRYRGHSTGCLGSIFGFWIGFSLLALIIGWPLLIHGPLGIIFEVAWIIVAIIAAFGLMAAKGAHRAGRAGRARKASDEPVYDGDPPPGYQPPARPGGRSGGTRFQS